MPEFNGRSVYNPSVAPDTGEGLARGISAFGSSISGALQQRHGEKRQDAQRSEERSWQLQDRQAGWEHEEAVYSRRRNDAVADRKASKLEEEEAMANVIQGKLTALKNTYGIDADFEAAVSKMKPKAASEALDIYGGHKMNQWKREAEAMEKANSQVAGLETVQTQDGSFTAPMFKQKDGTMRPAGGAYPARQQPQMSPEEIDAAIASGGSVMLKKGDATVRFAPTKATAPKGYITNGNGEVKEFPTSEFDIPAGWTEVKPKATTPKGAPLKTGSAIF